MILISILSSMKKNKALLLDRDGVIIQMIYDQETGRIHTAREADQIKLIPFIFDLLKKTKKIGYLNIIISNQPDIGLGRISISNFDEIRKKIKRTLQKKGVPLDGEYYCFHHPFATIGKFRKRCSCRKPNIGLLKRAAKDFNLDLKNSYLLGDGVKDIIAGHKIGCKTILLANFLESEYLRLLQKKLKGIKPDYLVKNLKEVIKLLT